MPSRSSTSTSAIDPKVVDTLESTGMFQQVKALEFDVA